MLNKMEQKIKSEPLKAREQADLEFDFKQYVRVRQEVKKDQQTKFLEKPLDIEELKPKSKRRIDAKELSIVMKGESEWLKKNLRSLTNV